MSQPYNRPELGLGLGDALGMKGSVKTEVDGIIFPTVTLLDLSDTPYLRYGIPVGAAANRGAVAAESSYVGCQPGAQVAIQVTAVKVNNSTAAVIIGGIRILTAANVASLGVDARTQMVELSARESGAGTRRSSSVITGTDASSALGVGFDTVIAPAGDARLFTFPAPGIILYGNDPNGLPAVAVVHNTANEALNVTFFGKEWPLPG